MPSPSPQRSRRTGRPASRRSRSPPSAGSTNTGSVDVVGELADLAEREDLWLHVDAAYGGAARLSARDAGRVPDLERADSVTVDPHKWFFQAYDIGGLLVRRREDLRSQPSTASPEYYRSNRPRTSRCTGTSTRWRGPAGSAR